MRKLLYVMMMGLGSTAAADGLPDVVSVIYQCDRDVRLPVTYINAGGFESVAVMQVEGRQVAMRQFVSASGAKYASFDEELGYRWWSKGDIGFLTFLAADHTAEEVDLLMDCHVITGN